MAEIFVDEGLDHALGVLFDAATQDTTFFVGLFTSQTATTVPARTAVLGASPTGITEMTASSGTYARQAISAGAWGAPATNGNGRRTINRKRSGDRSSGCTRNRRRKRAGKLVRR